MYNGWNKVCREAFKQMFTFELLTRDVGLWRWTRIELVYCWSNRLPWKRCCVHIYVWVYNTLLLVSTTSLSEATQWTESLICTRTCSILTYNLRCQYTGLSNKESRKEIKNGFAKLTVIYEGYIGYRTGYCAKEASDCHLLERPRDKMMCCMPTRMQFWTVCVTKCLS